MGDSKKSGLLSMAWLLPVLMLTGCASSVRPDKLPAPQSITCLDVRQPLSFTAKRGLFKIEWETRLERGAYISEKEDANGTYYRAPPGGIYEGRVDMKGRKPGVGTYMTYDGGIFIPHDANAAPSLYKYFSTASAPVEVPPESMNCATMTYVRDPNTRKISVVSMAAATGIGAAAGSVIGTSFRSAPHMSYGQAAGVGLVGGAIGGLIVAAIINSEVGEIQPGPSLDSQTQAKIRMLAANKVVVRESGHSAATVVAPTATAPAPSDSPAQAVAPAAATAAAPATVADSASLPSPSPAASTAVASTDVTAAPTAQAAPVMASMAQSVATQLGCGTVQASGDAAYTASCGSYAVFIGCDGGQCRPLHTVNTKDKE